MDHLPGCKKMSIADICREDGSYDAYFNEHGKFPPEDIRIMICQSGCPIQAAAIRRGIELAKEHGWES